MSSLIGAPGERWSLARAIDAMGDAVRQVGTPGLVWMLGILYPSLALTGGPGGDFLLGIVARGPSRMEQHQFETAIVGMVVTVLFGPRIGAGLARIGAPETWRELTESRAAPRVRDAWRASKGLGWSTLALWMQVLVMLVLPSLFVFAPPLLVLEKWNLLPIDGDETKMLTCAIVLGPFAAIALAYGFLLSVLNQLALQSLVHNRRGASSALLHAWKLARHDPLATSRAVVCELVLSAPGLLLFLAFGVFGLRIATMEIFSCVLSALCCMTPILLGLMPFLPRVSRALLAMILFPGFLNVARAAYWARAYRALGGLAPSDGVPGLPSAILRAPSAG